ncbi:MupA/Atu3671 family FMN-dependent luciferase-like monooxygenase [Chamaesiphon sp.]|uniref:MupA/Atu3671 family FMN-dependent luciferase-like monooxygenase n=1 Tax=Chamaesiphon sp. TaxID=2814140 RepID=UPI003593F432
MSSLSCYVVGDGVVVVSCLEVLLQQGWQVLGIYSADGSLQEWSQAHDIFYAADRSTFQAQILSSEYDYLFSINNTHWIIPESVVTQARGTAINYHDSPLPKYAGLYATAWAIQHGETHHAVTWHEVVDEIDAGRIFHQKVVPILADDTSLSLNTRCFEAAVESFTELIGRLATGSIEPYEQDLSQRTYFGPSHRPDASSLLSFEVTSHEIWTLARSLDFGHTRNPLGMVKIWLPGGVIVVESARIVTTAYGTPGRVLKLDADGLCIATADGAIEFRRMSTIDGRELSVERAIEDYGIRVGGILPKLDPDLTAAISQRNADICRHEQVWAKRAEQLAPFEHPYLTNLYGSGSRHQAAISRQPLDLNNHQVAATSLLSMFAAYCARLSPEPNFDLGLQTEAQRSVAPQIFAQRVPFRVKVQAGESFSQFQIRLATALERTARLGSFRQTLLRRYLELRDNPLSRALPVAIVSAPSPDRLDWQNLNATMALVAYEDGSAPELVHAGSLAPGQSSAIVSQLENLIAACVDRPEQPLERLPLLSSIQQQQLAIDWNQTATPVPDLCIHQLVEQQVARTPEQIAVACCGEELTYQELNERANQLAHYLRRHGIGPDALVGLYLERSVSMMVGLLAIHKAGGGYLPLDPDFPADRLAFMLADSQATTIITQEQLIPKLAIDASVRTVAIDSEWDEIARQPISNPESGVMPANLSYIIYTSGSTGKPKGVMVEHRNVVNFCTGMDARIDHQPPGVWLAVTSLSFDISVLELFWTLARGFKVVIYNAKAARSIAPSGATVRHRTKPVDFSLFYFSSHEQGADTTDKYRLLFAATEFADRQGFKAVWTPERHFHAFGGLFPNAAVTSAAIAARTNQIQIRAGSCVAPLHSSIRIAEDWAVVDNMSGGRVGISFAAGWQPNDFVLRPETYANRKEMMFEQIEQVQALWRGESISYPNGKGELVAVQTLPRPIQSKLPIWVTAAGNPETFQMAGAKGFNILTHLLGQSLDDLASKIAIYRQAWAENHHPGQGTVTLMIHTFVGENDAAVREIVRQPMRQYLASSLDLIRLATWEFPTFKQQTTDESGKFSVDHLSEQALDELLDFSFERYYETSGLFGTVETCLKMVERIMDVDVDEIACLIDYGVDTDLVLSQLPLLDRVKVESQARSTTAIAAQDHSFSGSIDRHQVTHLQCTPSMASLLLADPDTRQALSQIQTMMVGGEALNESLAVQLQRLISGQIHNMYGPTETTIWSTTYPLDRVDGIVPLGRPIANTELYILDKYDQPVPVGIAGELLIGGKGVTRGYLNRSGLTQERFIANPFSTDPSARLYRTGDLVRYRSDGNLEFLGRIDFQVKVRGYRIELGEIETILSRHEAVSAATIVVREDIPGDKRLVAYVIPQPGQEPTTATMRAYLRSQLPEYMVPSNFVLLQSFPLTPNQKVDRQALPIPTLTAPPVAAPPAPPASIPATLPIPRVSNSKDSTEQHLREIWQKVLQIPVVQGEDNFFDIGGNSLVAVALISEIRSKFEVKLPLISLFRSPTVVGLAQEITEFKN